MKHVGRVAFVGGCLAGLSVACGGDAPPEPATPVAAAAPAPASSAEPIDRTPHLVIEERRTNPRYALSPDGRFIAAMSSTSGVLDIVDARGRTLATLRDVPGVDGAQFASGARGFVVHTPKEVQVLDLASLKLVDKFDARWTGSITSGQRLAFRVGKEESAFVDLGVPSVARLAGTSGMGVLSLSRSGKRLLLQDTENKLIVYDPEAAKPVGTFAKGAWFGFSADDRFLAIARDQTSLLVEIATGRETKIDAPNAYPGPAGTLLLLDAQAATLPVRVFDAAKSATTTLADASSRIAQWLEDGRVLVRVQDTHAMRVISAAGGPAVELGTLPASAVWAFSPSGERFVWWAEKEPIHVLDARTGASVAESKEPLASPHCQAAFGAAGAPLVLCSHDKGATLYDFSSSPPEQREIFAGASSRTEVVQSGTLLRTRCVEGEATWDVATGKRSFVRVPFGAQLTDAGRQVSMAKKPNEVRDQSGHAIPMLGHIALQQSGKLAASFDSSKGDVVIWDLERGAPVGKIDVAPRSVESVSFHPTRAVVIVASTRRVEAFDVSDPARPVAKATLDASPVSFPKTGSHFVMSDGMRLHFWDMTTWKRIRSFTTTSSNSDVAWSPDGERLAVLDAGSDTALPIRPRAVFVVDASTGMPVAKLDAGGFGSPKWSTDGATISLSNDQQSSSDLVAFDAKTFAKGKTFHVDTQLGWPRAAWITPGETVRVTFTDRPTEVRKADGALLFTLGVARSGGDPACSIFAYDDQEHFDGEPLGDVHLRLGDDLRTAEIVDAGPALEAHRKAGMVAAVFGK